MDDDSTTHALSPRLSMAERIAHHRELEKAERNSLRAFDRAEVALFESLRDDPSGLPAGLHLSQVDWLVVVDRNERGLPVLRVSQQIAMQTEIERASANIETRVQAFRIRELEAAWRADCDRLSASLDRLLKALPRSLEEEALRIAFLAEDDRYEALNGHDWRELASSLKAFAKEVA